MKLLALFKSLFFLGCGICFFSLFLDFYSLRVYNVAGTLISSWDYSLLTGWTGSNATYRPPKLGLSIEFLVVYLGVVIVSVIATLLKNIEKTSDLRSFMPYAYLNIFLLLMIGFMIVVFPIFFLLPEELYFPFMIVFDESFNLTFHYAVGVPYYLQMGGFVMVFPYVIFHYHTIRTYILQKDDNTEKIQKLIQEENEYIDFDRYITEEKLKERHRRKENDKEFQFKINVLREGGL
jgi:hypothetical protein